MKYLKIIFLILILTYLCYPQPKEEVRAVWLTTAWGLDWPKSIRTVDGQKNALINILDKLKDANFNTIYFQVRARGDLIYKSEIEPWSVNLTGIMGRDPGYDPLQFAIEEAHKRGMELHAWVVVYKVYGLETPPATNPPHVLLSHPELCKAYGSEGYYMDPGYPETTTYLLNLFMEMIRKYDIDAIHFDYMRYPGSNFNDADSYAKYGQGQNKSVWRRENINKFVAAIYDSIQAVKPQVKVGSAPIGMYNFGNWPAYSELFQDSRKWIESGKHDYLAPQTYFKISGSNPSYEYAAKWWTKNLGKGNPNIGRHIYLASAVYKMSSSEGNWDVTEITNQIDSGRTYGSHGQSYFRTDSFILNTKTITTQLINNHYKYPANIPPMPWKDNVKPNSPLNLTLSTDDSLKFILNWEKPSAASDGDTAFYYNVYMDYSSPVNIDDIKNVVKFRITGGTTAEISLPEKPTKNLYFTVTAYDKGYNESEPSNEVSLNITSVKNKTEVIKDFNLKQNFPNPFNPSTTISFNIPASAFTTLKIYNVLGNEVASLLQEELSAGSYDVSFDISKYNLASGVYYYKLKSGSYSAIKKMVVLK